MPLVFDTFYLTATVLAAPYILARMFTSERFRAGLPQRLGRVPERAGGRPCFWVHAASVGEINTAAALIKAIDDEFNDRDIIISTSTNTGFASARKKFPDKLIFYFPLDFSWISRKVLTLLRPDCVILIELEVWPNFMVAAAERKIPVAIVNGRISEKSLKFFKVMGFLSELFYKSLSASGNIYCVRTRADASRFLQLGIPEEKVVITGTMKYDNLLLEVPEDVTAGLRRSFKIDSEEQVLVGGSTHPGEEEILLRTLKTLKATLPALRLIIAPRHIERAGEVEGYISAFGFAPVRKSALDRGEDFSSEPGNTVILVDTIGDLTNIYSLADCVFVGKSLKGQGGQNIMEPAALAKPTIFGPNMSNFEEEKGLLLGAEGAIMVRSEQDLLGAVKDILRNSGMAAEMGRRAREAVLGQRGATSRNMEVIKNL